jgi:hypothetical protein
MSDDQRVLDDAAGDAPDAGATERERGLRRRRTLMAAAASGVAFVTLGAIVIGATAAGGPQTEGVSTGETTTTTDARRTTTTTWVVPEVTTTTTSPPVTVPLGMRSTLPTTTIPTTPAPPEPREPAADTISGTLVDGRPWTLRHDADHGLCIAIGETDFGCDDEGPVLDPGDDPATPRVAVDGHDLPRDQLGVLVYAYLPAGATTVVIEWDGGRESADGLVIDPARRFWGIPLRRGDNPDRVSYRDAEGDEVLRFTISGHG